MSKLYEDSRQQLISKSKFSNKGRERYNKRKHSKVASSVKSFNQIDMNKLFKEGILTVNVPVHGETDDYIVKITFGGFTDILRDQIKGRETVEFRDISKTCIIGFNKADVFVSCSCPDFAYRFKYFASVNDFNSDSPETRPSDITNPDDKLGSSCKHVLLVLNNTSWILRVARVINNYIKYMEKHYSKLYQNIMYPAIFGNPYVEPVEEPTEDELQTDDTTIDTANEYNKNRTRFQKGNKQGIRFAKADNDKEEEQKNNIEDNIENM